MINESKQSSLEQFLIDQAAKKDIALDSDKAKIVDSEINQVVNESKKFTDWHKKSSTQAELKVRLRPVLEKLVFGELHKSSVSMMGNGRSGFKSSIRGIEAKNASNHNCISSCSGHSIPKLLPESIS